MDVINGIFCFIYYSIDFTFNLAIEKKFISPNNIKYNCLISQIDVYKSCFIFVLIPTVWLFILGKVKPMKYLEHIKEVRKFKRNSQYIPEED
jgi:hypothetical protein